MKTSSTTATTSPTQNVIVSPSVSLLKTKLTEFQCVLVLVSFESITDDASTTKMREIMAHGVLGDKKNGVASQINILLQGIDPHYKNLFLPSIDGCLVVNPLCSPNRGTKQLKVGQHLTFRGLGRANVLSSTKNNDISGVTLKRQAEETFKNEKIALSFAIQYLDSNGGLLDYILDKMWDRKIVSTKQVVDVEQTAAGQRSSDDAPKEYQPSWIFKEYVDFCLYGCPVLTQPKDHIANFSTDSQLKGPKSSHRFARQQKKLDKQKQKCISVMNEPVSGSIKNRLISAL